MLHINFLTLLRVLEVNIDLYSLLLLFTIEIDL